MPTLHAPSTLYPYGELTTTSGSSQSVFGYTGEETDSNGLVNLRARYYNPALGQFFSLNPLETPNRYQYVGDNPVNRRDPSGMQSDQDGIGAQDYSTIVWAFSQGTFDAYQQKLERLGYYKADARGNNDYGGELLLAASFYKAKCQFANDYDKRVAFEYDIRLFINGFPVTNRALPYTPGNLVKIIRTRCRHENARTIFLRL